MAKLTKLQRKNHEQACKLLEKDVLTFDDKIFVLENWHEGANHVNSAAGAFFTPCGLARDFAIDAGGGRSVIDLCAGIGGLMFWLIVDRRARPEDGRLVCVEMNPDYVAVGKKVVPEAEWIQADVLNLPADIGTFDLAVSNPPFGTTPRKGSAPRYKGRRFEYHVMDVAQDLASYGAFIIPQSSASFVYSGQRHYRETITDEIASFQSVTGIEMQSGCGIDTGFYLNDWHDVKPMCEVVTVDFDNSRAARIAAGVMAAAAAGDFDAEPVAVQATLF